MLVLPFVRWIGHWRWFGRAQWVDAVRRCGLRETLGPPTDTNPEQSRAGQGRAGQGKVGVRSEL